MAESIGALLVKIGADTSDFVSALNSADKAVGKFTNTLDKRLLDPLLKVSGAASAAAGGLFLFAKSAADTVDELGKLSQKVGVSVESLSALKYAAELSDVSLDQLGTGLKQLSKFMVENQITGVSTEEMLLRIAEDFSKSKDGAEKTAAAMKFFGKAGADLIPMLNEGRAGIEALRKEAERLGVVFSTEAAKKAQEFNDNLSRLKATAEGLKVEIAGPLVTAINEAAKAMLEAKKNGEGWGAAMLEAFRTFTTGNDLIKWTKEADEALQRLSAAERNVARLSQLGGQAAASGLVKAREELAAAREEVERLQKIKPILEPDAPEEAKKPAPTGTVSMPNDPKAEEARLREIMEIRRRVGEERDKQELDQIAKQNEEKAAAEQKAFEDQQKLEDYFRELRDEQRRQEYQIQIQAEEEKERAIYGIIVKHRQLNLASAKTFFSHMAGLMQTQSKKLFEIGKAGAIAETIVNTYTAAMAAYKSLAGIPIVGPALGAAAAAAAVATGMAQVQQIRSQQVGGGGVGGGAAVATFDANASTGLPSGTPGGDVGRGGEAPMQRIFNINVSGSSRAVFEEFAAGMNRLADEGFQFRLNGKPV